MEDRRLGSIDWFRSGYRLFEISSWGGSNPYGWLGPIAESNFIFLSKQLFAELGGYDEAFVMLGGGLVNLDFFKRAVETPGVQSVYLFGEGCFHQVHGGVTSGEVKGGYTFNQLDEECRKLRGQNISPRRFLYCYTARRRTISRPRCFRQSRPPWQGIISPQLLNIAARS